MQHVTLQHTDLTVSRACFGTMTFAGQADQDVSTRMVDVCLDAGINFFDTANVYQKGHSEVFLGNALKARRHRAIIASKVRHQMSDDPFDSGLSRAAIMKAIDDTLRRLQTDYLDIYYMHQPDYTVGIDESLEAMNDLVRSGKVRYIASSNYAAWQVTEMFWLADKRGWQPPSISQPMYNLIARGIEPEYLPMCKRLGVSTVVYNPLAGGLLTGKHQAQAPIEGSRFDKNQMYLDRYWHPAYFEAVEDLRRAAEGSGRSMVSLALNWLLHHTSTDCVILGASRVDQLESNLKAMEEGPLPAQTVEACDQVWAKLRGVTPRYNR